MNDEGTARPHIVREETSFEDRLKKNPWYDYRLPRASRLVSAAYNIAEEAHLGQTRRKKEGKIPYITHPLMVCKLLELVGANDDINLAVALLHDVLEDCKPYKDKPEVLEKTLQERLEAQGMTEENARNSAANISRYCTELYTAKHMNESKRIHQLEHLHHMSPRSKLIKSLDQIASMMDDIFFAPDFSDKKLQEATFKAMNVVKAVGRNSEDMTQQVVYVLCSRVFRYLCQITNDYDEQSATAKRRLFEPDALFDGVRGAAVDAYRQRAANEADRMLTGGIEDSVCAIRHPAFTRNANTDAIPKQGCVAVEVTMIEDEPFIRSYDMMVDVNQPETSACNRSALFLLGTMESFMRREQVMVEDKVMHGDALVRRYRIEPPIAKATFLRNVALAEEALSKNNEITASQSAQVLPQILDQQMKLAIEDEARALQRARRGGP